MMKTTPAAAETYQMIIAHPYALTKYNNFGRHEKGQRERLMAADEIVMCDNCGNPIESCMCVCPYCGKKDACECCLHDAVTGG
ncbi:hypothetical protein [Nitrososphaera sp.]|uniref:hypothetical protein n=1 Tax=Nitrososphaera sp. TaxID=1971748 RepID=UPI00307E0FF1